MKCQLCMYDCVNQSELKAKQPTSFLSVMALYTTGLLIAKPWNVSEFDQSGHYFYHYTNKKSITKIQKSRTLNPSTNETVDCAYGKGVYFTTLMPTNSKR